MSNSLNRTIKPGEIVIIAARFLADKTMPDRRFRCLDGFGMSQVTIGTALFGEWLIDGEKSRIDSHHIDAEETDLFQAILRLATLRLYWRTRGGAMAWGPATYEIDVPGIGKQTLEGLIPGNPDFALQPMYRLNNGRPATFTRPRRECLYLAAHGGGLTEDGIPARMLAHFSIESQAAVIWLIANDLAVKDVHGNVKATAEGRDLSKALERGAE